ncbi:hydroxyacylglutathione hydrolase family protein [Candidatus Bathyarchaeota archaeon]|nr:hydroxyacylglutathione hydrolase family protein [Candidatus Bathyarchaeota archaeon]
MFFKQVQQHGDNFSYVIADKDSREAAVVDSSFNAGKIMQILKENNLVLKFVINTHGHSDHIAGTTELRSILKAQILGYKYSRTRVDVGVDDGDVIQVGKILIKVIYTPGHTKDSISLLVGKKKLLTGDTLFVGECGRTDMPGGSSEEMYDSLNKIMKLHDNVQVFPGHDYGNARFSTIGEEKHSNYTLKPRSLNEFIKFMNEP